MIKNIIDKIIQDLGDDRPINGILLKVQIVASRLNNKEFENWINNEQNGYSDAKNIPSYRVLGAIVKADIFRPYDGLYRNCIIPPGIFGKFAVLEYTGNMQMKAPEITGTTEQERREYVREMWKCMHNCEMCGRCSILRGRDPEELYADYISGKCSYTDASIALRDRDRH